MRANAPLQNAPARADAKKTWRALKTSATFRTAYRKVPVTKPAWTATVSQAAPDGPRPHSRTRAGATAVPENQVAEARRTDRQVRKRARPAPGASASVLRRPPRGPAPA